MERVTYTRVVEETLTILRPEPVPEFLLDFTSATPFVAFGTRRLNQNYSGSALRVRRSIDDTEQDIGFDGEDLDVTSLIAFVTNSGASPTANGFIKTWYDQSGNGLDVSQSTLAAQPWIVSSGAAFTQNGHAVVREVGGVQGLERASTTWTSAPLVSFFVAGMTIFSSANNKTIWQHKNHFSGGGGHKGIILHNSGAVMSGTQGWGAFGDGNALEDPTAESTTAYFDLYWHQVDLKLSSSECDLYQDGWEVPLLNEVLGIDPPTLTDTMYLLSWSTGSSGLEGDCGEFVIFKSDPGATDRATLRANQMAYWFPVTDTLLTNKILPQPTGAWSLRKVNGRYTGNCIRVRRSSDDNETNIGFDGNDLDTTALLAFVGTGGSDNGFVVDRFDQATNISDRKQTQAIFERQPQIVAAGVVITTINSEPTLLNIFGGYLSLSAGDAAVMEPNRVTVIATARPTDVASGSNIIQNTAIGNDTYFGVGFGNSQFGTYNEDAGGLDFAIHGTTPSNNTNYVVAGQHAGGNIKAWLNGGTAVTTASGNTIFTYFIRNMGGLAKGYFNDALIYDVELSAADLNILGADMAAYAGVTWTNI